MSQGRAYPNLNRIQDVSLEIAADVATYAFSQNLSELSPVPSSIKEFIKSKMYKAEYN